MGREQQLGAEKGTCVTKGLGEREDWAVGVRGEGEKKKEGRVGRQHGLVGA